MTLTDWLLPGAGRLSSSDIQLGSRLGAQLPPAWHAGMWRPSRGERRALPRWHAASDASSARYDALLLARLPGLGDADAEADRRFRAAARRCRLLLVLDAGSASAAGAAPAERLLARCSSGSSELRLYRGDLSDPLLRVDDYPTGVRPILEDLTLLHDVLRRIDDSGLTFHLGIVPAIVEDRMESFLKSLRHLVVSMHGFEHGYAKLSKVLLEAGDPFNQRGTVGGFDEFADASYAEVLSKLTRGRDLLEARTGQRPISYIPPTNEGGRKTGRALEQLGFEYVLSERPIPGCKLPSIASDFYDRSSKLQPGQRPQVASLHATWEADLLRDGDRESLPGFLKTLVEQRREGRAEVSAVAERMASAFERG